MREKPKVSRAVAAGHLLGLAGLVVVTVAFAFPTAASATAFCLGGLGPMGVCNQGHPHSITAIGTSNSTGDQSCETEKTGGATSSPLRYSWA